MALSEVDHLEASRTRSLKPLATLLPYLGHYRGMVVKALIFLTLAAVATLALPLAVRRMIDQVFRSRCRLHQQLFRHADRLGAAARLCQRHAVLLCHLHWRADRRGFAP